MSGKMEWAGIQLVVSTKGVTGGLWADNRLVKQMLLNLVSNAVKFSQSNTRILLSVTQAGDRSIQFSVADQGIGIAVDGAGNAYVTGETSSTEATFPVTGGPDLTFNGGTDAFVAKVNAAGTLATRQGFILKQDAIIDLNEAMSSSVPN